MLEVYLQDRSTIVEALSFAKHLGPAEDGNMLGRSEVAWKIHQYLKDSDRTWESFGQAKEV